MPAGYTDIFLDQGTTYREQLTLDDQYGTPYNLVSYSVESKAKKSYYQANASITFVATVYDGANGIIQLALDSANTANVAGGTYLYDVKITDSISGNKTRVLEGRCFVSPAVT